MSHLVVIEVAGGGEPFTTDPALVGLFTAVDSSVSIEAARGRKAFVTYVTYVRPFPCMNPYMPFKKTRTIEGFAAVVTR